MKSKIWKYATVLVVILIIFNPEMSELAIFVDAVGLEVFLMLLEIQLLAILSVFFNSKIVPIYTYLKYLYSRYIISLSWQQIKEEPASLMLVVPCPATLMCMLVLSAAFGIAVNAH